MGAAASAAMVCGVLAAPAVADPAPLLQTAASGSGAGQLSTPVGIAVDGGGNVYVADANNRRVDEFGPADNFIRAFGKAVIQGVPMSSGFDVCTAASGCQAGDASTGAPGELSLPSDVTFDPAGHLYVTESGANRVSEFDLSTPTPTFIRAFGWDVVPGGPAGFETCTTSCQAGTQGQGAGQFWSPYGVAVDAAGNLYLAELQINRIEHIDVSSPSASFVNGLRRRGGRRHRGFPGLHHDLPGRAVRHLSRRRRRDAKPAGDRPRRGRPSLRGRHLDGPD